MGSNISERDSTPFLGKMTAEAKSAVRSKGLRERHAAGAVPESIDGANSSQQTPQDDNVAKQKRTFGRTPDGTSKSSSLNERIVSYTSANK